MKAHPALTDLPPCNLCGSRSAHYLYPDHRLLQCEECGLVRADRIPDRQELKRLYSERYFRSTDSGALGYDDYIADRVKIVKTFHRRMHEIEQWTGRKGRLLDVGCAAGFSLAVAKERGWDVQGVEISEFACRYARETLGMNVLCGSLDDADLEPETFDVIAMWDYIEHGTDPTKELAEANRLLRKEGLLALTTPDIASLPARLWGTRWMGIKQGEHLYYFTAGTMKQLLIKCQFEPVRLRHVGKYVDIAFFVKRAGRYSAIAERILTPFSRFSGLRDHVLYVNPFDIMLVYGRKTGSIY